MKCIKGESCLYCGSNYCRFVDELDQLKAKNEELKKINKSNDETWKTMSITFDNGTVKTEVTDISMAEYSQLKLENTKLKQTLTEIKEFIQSDYCTEIASCEFCAEVGNCLNRKILQKISEVIK